MTRFLLVVVFFSGALVCKLYKRVGALILIITTSKLRFNLLVKWIFFREFQ